MENPDRLGRVGRDTKISAARAAGTRIVPVNPSRLADRWATHTGWDGGSTVALAAWRRARCRADQHPAWFYHRPDGTIKFAENPPKKYEDIYPLLVITRDGRFAYTANADSQAISGYRIHSNGTISLLDPTVATATTPNDTFPPRGRHHP